MLGSIRKVIAATLFLAAFASGAAHAQTKIALGVTSAASWSTAFIAADQGFFAKHNIDAAITILALNPQIPAAIQSGSLQIGGITPAGMMQAIDGDLDLVAVAGGIVTANKATRQGTGTGLLVRAGFDFKSAQDLVGKKIGVPGIGSGLDVQFRLWLKAQGVDHRKVSFVELAFPQQSDALKAGIVDGAVSIDPFLTRTLDAKTGTLAVDFLQTGDDGILNGVYAATRQWAEANAQAARDFRQALADGYDFQIAHPDEARAIVGKFLKLPPQVVATMTLFTMERDVRGAQLQYWADAMADQGWIKKIADASKFVFH